MTDASTAIGRDQEREKGIHYFLNGVKSYLKGNLSLKKVKERAEQVSDIRGGYFGGQIDLTVDLEETLKGLKKRDKQIWADFLYNYWILPELYELSPFDSKILFRVEYGGSRNAYVDFSNRVDIKSFKRGLILEDTIAKIIQDKGWITYGNDHYLVAIRTVKVENQVASVDGIESYWIGNSVQYRCSDGMLRPLVKPRKADDWNIYSSTPEQRDKYCGFKK